MKRTFQTALILSLLFGSAAMADDRDGRHDRDRDRGNGHSDHRRDDDRRDGRHDWRDDDRRDGRDWRDNRSRRYRAGEYRRPPGYVVRAWRRGDRLPHAYRGRTYIVRDYHVYHLRRPPRGHHWVRVDRDVILAAIATGVVLDVLYNHFH